MAAIVSAINFSFQMIGVYCYFNKNIYLVKNIYYFTHILTAAMVVQTNKNVLSIWIRTESTPSGSLQYSSCYPHQAPFVQQQWCSREAVGWRMCQDAVQMSDMAPRKIRTMLLLELHVLFNKRALIIKRKRSMRKKFFFFQPCSNNFTCICYYFNICHNT